LVYILGIDGGGTKTVAVLVDSEGRFIRTVESGPTNYVQHGREYVVSQISELVKNLRIEGRISSLCVGLAGVGRSSDLEEVNEAVSSLGVAEKSEVVTDGLIALYAATGGQAGVVLISGTGSIAWGFDGKARVERSDGWGYLLGDLGSGFDIGRSAMVAALEAYDGRGEHTSLLPAMLQYFGAGSPDDVIKNVYGKQPAVPLIAGFAPLVIREAKNGDRVASRILDNAARHLSDSARAVMRKLSVPIGNVYVEGGIFKDELMRFKLQEKLSVRVAISALSPVMGAVIRAAQNYGIVTDEKFMENLRVGQELMRG